MSNPEQFRTQAARIILAQFNKMMAQEKGVLLGQDIECLHRMRVASRRLRARVRDFEPLFGGRRYLRIEKQVRRITRQLGVARDLDVFEAFLKALPQAAGPAPNPETTAALTVPPALLLGARELQAASRHELTLFFQELRRRGRSARIRAYLRGQAQGPIDKRVLRAHMRSFSRRVIQPRLKALEAYRHKRFTGACGPVELHRMRICAKKLRYSMEIFEIYYGADFGELILAVRELQDHAGQVHDLEVHAQRVLDFVLQGRLSMPAAEPVLARCSGLHAEAFSRFQKVWRVFWRLNLAVRLHRYWAGAAAGIPG